MGNKNPLDCVVALGIGLAALLAGSAALAADFRCADLKPSNTRQPAYQRVVGQVRCEGFYERNVSQPFVELISLTASAIPTQVDAALQISGSARGPVQLIVQPLRPAPFYRVDALVETAKTLSWNPSPMLDATGLQLRDLGFLALASESEGTRTLVPVSFATSPAASNAANGVLRASVPITKLAWRRLRIDGSDDGSSAWRDIPGPARFAWERIPVSFELPADGRGARIEVQAVDADGKILPLLHFNVSGPNDAGR